MKLPIYLDYSATTPVDPRVAQKMVNACWSTGTSVTRRRVPTCSAGKPKKRSRTLVARWPIWSTPTRAKSSGPPVPPSPTTWQSRARHFYATKGKHLITSKIEHKAVLDTMRQLEREGFEVTYLEPGEDGLITPAMIEAALRDDTILVSVMHVNNEIGTINDIAAIGELTRSRGRPVPRRRRSVHRQGRNRPAEAESRPDVVLRPQNLRP
jgi:cysteine desulfurase